MGEQNVALEIEIESEEKCIHFVLYKDGEALATCRLQPIGAGQVKLQRMAVLKEQRGKHLGQALIAAVEEYAQTHDFTKVVLGAQNTAIIFYEKLGYKVVGKEFMDANIPHHGMEKQIR